MNRGFLDLLLAGSVAQDALAFMGYRVYTMVEEDWWRGRTFVVEVEHTTPPMQYVTMDTPAYSIYDRPVGEGFQTHRVDGARRVYRIQIDGRYGYIPKGRQLTQQILAAFTETPE